MARFVGLEDFARRAWIPLLSWEDQGVGSIPIVPPAHSSHP